MDNVIEGSVTVEIGEPSLTPDPEVDFSPVSRLTESFLPTDGQR